MNAITDKCHRRPLWISSVPYRTCDCHYGQRARLEVIK